MLSEPLVQLNYASINLLEDPDFRKQVIAWLSRTERQRLEQFRQPQQADQYLLARAMLRYQLSQKHPEILPQQWQFEVDAQGKPQLAPLFSHLNIHFNLSHSEDMVALAISEGVVVGADIEADTRLVFNMALAQRYFADSEIHWLRSLPVEQQLPGIVQLWTLKESYLKAEGLGLRVPLRKLVFSFSGAHALSLELSSDCDDIKGFKKTDFCALYRLGTNYSLALTVKADRRISESDVKVEQWCGLRQDMQHQYCQLLRTTFVEN